MEFLLCWLVAPAGLLLATVGLSLLLERPLKLGLPWTVRPALGMAVAIVLAQFGTATAASAKLTLAAILVIAAIGLVLGRKVPAARPSGLEVAVGLIVFALFASPFVIVGEATWAGYIKLDDTATWMAITDHVFEHGRGLGDLPASTHHQVIIDYLGGTYPIGGFIPAALMAKLSGVDVAFTMQPSMAFAAGSLALVLFELARRLLRAAGLAALIAIVASLSSLLLGYYLWGGVKELVVAALLPLVPLLAGCAAGAKWSRGWWAPLGVAVAATICVLGPGGGVWVVALLVPAVLGAVRERGLGGALRLVVPAALFSALLVVPVIFGPTGTFDPLNGGINEDAGLGNLIAPLDRLQVAGIWPAIDFRFSPHLHPLVTVLALLCLLVAALTVVLAARRGPRDGLPLVGYVAGGILGAALIAHFGSPWVDGKAMASISPAVLLAALIGLARLGRRRPAGLRVGALVVGLLVAGIVAWSAFLAYQGVWFAPRAPNVELEEIGEQFAGEGPALSTEVSIYGPRHFLRKLDAQGASDRRTNAVLLRNGGEPAKGQAVDLDELDPATLDPYNLIVVRRTPAASRPPAGWELVHSGTYYDVWKRGETAGALREHLPLGTSLDSGDIPECGEVKRLAEVAGDGGKLLAARAGSPIAIEFSSAQLPAGWSAPTPYTVSPTGFGTLGQTLEVGGGSYEIWLGGAVFGGVELRIDNQKVAERRAVVENVGAVDPIGSVKLARGEHWLELEYSGADLWPGSAAHPYEIGPLLFEAPGAADPGTVSVSGADYHRLCGRRWDWIEAYSR